MKVLLITALLYIGSLHAIEISFSSFRTEEKHLALEAFKKLYKKRQNIHRNLRQVLKHSRAKNLQKNHLSFFQAKSTQLENSGVFLIADDEADMILPESPDASLGDTEIGESESSSGDDINDGSMAEDALKEDGVRHSVSSPWALR